MQGGTQILSPQSENDRLLFRRYNSYNILYYKHIFSIQCSVNNGLRTEDLRTL